MEGKLYFKKSVEEYYYIEHSVEEYYYKNNTFRNNLWKNNTIRNNSWKVLLIRNNLWIHLKIRTKSFSSKLISPATQTDMFIVNVFGIWQICVQNTIIKGLENSIWTG